MYFGNLFSEMASKSSTALGQSFDKRDLATSVGGGFTGAQQEALSYLGQLDKSDAQKNFVSAIMAQQFESDQAEKNREWQKMMSDTSYQRAVADMQKAGINPALAYQQGGASTPSGSMASGKVVSSSGSSALSRIVGGLFNTAISVAGGIAGKAIGAKIGASAAATRLSDKLAHDMEKVEVIERGKDYRNYRTNDTKYNIHSERLEWDMEKWYNR